ncbi:unnamed protein product [Polarella glacialis]|uniref:Uncharacterized protein n=1 Tax=Polarella glacialis TaxID=89957 RepID=A0A813DK41_POLGL|nr:unnamed protein product [Polarella glacialis]CAE8720386.1 unnamed protein product [Polarella glacialis]CAE8736656.1 unnamed protein product [Polarella glacialis]|mmetsp:Transcript_17600/g.28159  ORF Transcript_17600/g.28159 Transcript_17600/m.28159 type:complete len:247 (-) Transcript_17600:446-1186(-)|eukprot:CAMPEP_0115049298 /NCGR_PEP_ID=MMETSP0227-20121206/1105_1 /TAXON_ID=89957 /ORGANISM="Polarella glacialis, Strain CCMP 1383" /LENGTH=246 /DNA_ID=CAMNT_0002432935 /DNA_START=55 /DNA_END=795 /DNA_ORIENTATION=-
MAVARVPAECRVKTGRKVLGPLLLILGASFFCFFSGEGNETTFTGGSLSSWTGSLNSLAAPDRQIASESKVAMGVVGITEARLRYDGTTKHEYLRRLKFRRECAGIQYTRKFGYVMKWDDKTGEGVVIDQEQTQKYLVIRDDITKCYHNHKTLGRAEFIEFFATDEMDEVAGLPLAKNVTGAHGGYVKGSEEFRNVMLDHGTFPKRWKDEYSTYEKKVGEWYLAKKWRCTDYKLKKTTKRVDKKRR